MPEGLGEGVGAFHRFPKLLRVASCEQTDTTLRPLALATWPLVARNLIAIRPQLKALGPPLLETNRRHGVTPSKRHNAERHDNRLCSARHLDGDV